MNYINKSDGTIQTREQIEKELGELLGNTSEFDEYRDNIHKFIENYYEVEQ